MNTMSCERPYWVYRTYSTATRERRCQGTCLTPYGISILQTTLATLHRIMLPPITLVCVLCLNHWRTSLALGSTPLSVAFVVDATSSICAFRRLSSPPVRRHSVRRLRRRMKTWTQRLSSPCRRNCRKGIVMASTGRYRRTKLDGDRWGLLANCTTSMCSYGAPRCTAMPGNAWQVVRSVLITQRDGIRGTCSFRPPSRRKTS
ncbi:hypothetical protein HDV64DRAFT_188279 [Trichoderma sp. TUCIM 5745]